MTEHFPLYLIIVLPLLGSDSTCCAGGVWATRL